MPAVLPPATSLKIIRAAMVTGVLLLGAVAWKVSHARPAGELAPLTPALTYVGAGLLFAGLAGFFVIRGRLTPATPPQMQVTLSILALALAEAAALFGGVMLLITGVPTLWILGMLLVLGVAMNVGIRD